MLPWPFPFGGFDAGVARPWRLVLPLRIHGGRWSPPRHEQYVHGGTPAQVGSEARNVPAVASAWSGSGRGDEGVAGAAHSLQASGTVTEFVAEGARKALAPAQAGPVAVHQLASEAGFTRFRQVTQTPVNVVLELRP
jgi:hypothetical protein